MDETDEKTAGPAASSDPPPSPPPQAVAAPGWRTPAVWMACGALLAMVAGGGAVLVHRVSVERDMDQLARLLPPSASASGPAAAAVPVEARPPVPAPALPPSAVREPGPVPVPPPVSEAGNAVSPQQPSEAKVATDARRSAGSKASAKGAKRPLQARAATGARSVKAAGAKDSPRSPAARRRAQRLQIYYSEIFRRCPQPGEPGAIECRRHICNGAESEGPACKPYRYRPR